MAILRLNPADFASYHQQLAARFQPALVRGVHAGAARVVQYLTERTRVAPPANPAGIGEGGAVNTGAFLRGWRWLPLGDGAVVLNVERHGPTVEWGRRAGKMPPANPIIAWLRRRLGLSLREAERMAFVVRRAIGNRGLLPRMIMTSHESTMRQLDLIRDEVAHELERELSRRPR